MPNILSLQRFQSEYIRIKDRYDVVFKKILQEKSSAEFSEEEKRFQKLGRIFVRIESAYTRKKMYAIKNLNALERHQVLFRDEKRAVIVQAIELLEKVILHKKLNREF